MAERLVLCVACSRHIKASETRCPFCGEMAVRASLGDPFRRMAAAAAVAAGVTALTACGGGNTPGNTFSGGVTTPVESLDGSPNLVPSYDAHALYPQDGSGVAADDSSSGEDDASATDGGERDAPSDAREDSPSVVAFYGLATPMKDGEADGA